ncbi:hypothetical protein M0804_013616 [Polistes exclamans]|nr:hypothetical protein M0804_013616 [Polistes exclamans]
MAEESSQLGANDVMDGQNLRSFIACVTKKKKKDQKNDKKDRRNHRQLYIGLNLFKVARLSTADLLKEGAPEGQTDEVSKIVLICKSPKIDVRLISPTTT